ncbi:MAG: hypothetical protein V7605_2343 [Acidimicrobiaceae bacterium]
MGNEQTVEADERLMEELWGLDAGFGPIPADVTAAAVDAYSWRTTGAEVAGLIDDTGLGDDGGLTDDGARPGPRRLRFAGTDLTVDVEVDADGDELAGRLVPPGPATVELRGPCNRAVVTADRGGRFSVPVPTGAFSLRCRRGRSGSRPDVVTDWVTL